MTIIEMLQEMLVETQAIPLKDGSGKVMTIEGIDSLVRARTLAECIYKAKRIEANETR